MKRVLSIDTIKYINEEIVLLGWIENFRKHGKISFWDIRDRKGIIQAVDTSGKLDIDREDVVKIIGIVKKRPEMMINPKLVTGMVEIEIKQLDIISKAADLPFPIDTPGYDINEEIRLKYRYLDLRRSRLSRNIRLRSQFVQKVREFLLQKEFVEIETPLLTKSTPEGSRDFLVPSRLQQGKFYALPQSPQQYKQLLMVAGFEKYFQIARCLRDEDLRADRGFEHTQIDVEMSFVERGDVMSLLEEMIIFVFEKLGQRIKQKPFPVYSYQQAVKNFGADKFDLRSSEDRGKNIHAFAWVVNFPFFKKDKTGSWTFTHNPFSNPKPEFINDILHQRNIEAILTSQYDLVCNGFEVGGGSIRSHDPQILQSVFQIMGYKKEDIMEQFGHILHAFSFGVPPHGGCALGVDRLAMILTGEKYLREVVAFPMTAGGQTAVMDAPNVVSADQLRQLGLSVIEKKE